MACSKPWLSTDLLHPFPVTRREERGASNKEQEGRGKGWAVGSGKGVGNWSDEGERGAGEGGGKGYKAVEWSIWLVTCTFLKITKRNHFMCLQDLVNRGSEQLMLLKQ